MKDLGRVPGPGIYPALRDAGIGLVSVLPWLALFACLYWLLARRVLSTVDDELLRSVLTLAGMGAATGLRCLLAPARREDVRAPGRRNCGLGVRGPRRSDRVGVPPRPGEVRDHPNGGERARGWRSPRARAPRWPPP
ncbi:MAG: hypothetical protein ABGY09_05625 [Euryarchaeota archaeon]